MQVLLATVNRKVLDESCHSVVLPTTTGQIEVLPGHAPLLTQLATGVARIKKNADEHGTPVVVQSGFAQVSHDALYVLAEVAERAAEIDRLAAQNTLQEAERKLQAGGLTPEQITEEFQKISLQRARLSIAQDN